MASATTDLARSYYTAIDGGDYETLRDLLADEFVQHRPDRTLEGADAFVRFMREERPETDTTHVVERVYRSETATPTDAADDPLSGVAAEDYVAVEGRLERASGESWFRFVDTFAAADGRLTGLVTYTM